MRPLSPLVSFGAPGVVMSLSGASLVFKSQGGVGGVIGAFGIVLILAAVVLQLTSIRGRKEETA